MIHAQKYTIFIMLLGLTSIIQSSQPADNGQTAANAEQANHDVQQAQAFIRDVLGGDLNKYPDYLKSEVAKAEKTARNLFNDCSLNKSSENVQKAAEAYATFQYCANRHKAFLEQSLEINKRKLDAALQKKEELVKISQEFQRTLQKFKEKNVPKTGPKNKSEK